MRPLRARVAFPSEVHVESMAIPAHLERMHEVMRAAGLDPARHSVTGRTLQHTPSIQWRGPRPDLVIDDSILLPHQKMALEEARSWWKDRRT